MVLPFVVAFAIASPAWAESPGERFGTCDVLPHDSVFREGGYPFEAIQRGDLVIGSAKSPTGFFVLDPEERCLKPGDREAIRRHPMQTQSISADGQLLYQAARKDILAFPVSQLGGPGTAARSDYPQVFAGPLAVGGLNFFGAAVQYDGSESSIMLFEAYSRSHHQGSIWNAPSGREITWLGWGGRQNEHLFLLLRIDKAQNLLLLDPTFPDLTSARHDCYFSNKPATDCMMRSIRSTFRRVQLVLEDVRSVSIADWPPASDVQPSAQLD